MLETTAAENYRLYTDLSCVYKEEEAADAAHADTLAQVLCSAQKIFCLLVLG